MTDGSFIDQLKSSPGSEPAGPPKRPIHPSKNWEPRVDTEKGEIVVREEVDPDTFGGDPFADVDWDAHLLSWGFNPDHFEIDEPVDFRTWDAIPEKGVVTRFRYYKAKIRRKRRTVDLAALEAEIRGHRPRKVKPPVGDSTYVLCLADWQIGKRDEGGTKFVIQRVTVLIDTVLADIRRLRKQGVTLGHLLILGLGDLLEGCVGFYPAQLYNVELSGREQSLVAHRLLYKIIRILAPEFKDVTVAAVGGNHGEKRQDGRWVTDRGDNTDLELFDNLAFRLKENPDVYGHVRFVIPDQELAITVEAR